MTPCGRRPADVESDEMLRFVLVRGVEFIGEAASRVTRRGGPLHPFGVPLPLWATACTHLIREGGLQPSGVRFGTADDSPDWG